MFWFFAFYCVFVYHFQLNVILIYFGVVMNRLAFGVVTLAVVWTAYKGLRSPNTSICDIVRKHIPNGELSVWYNPCSIAAASNLAEKATSKLLTWSTGFSATALRYAADQRISYPIYTIPVEEGKLPSDQETYVGWDQGKVVELATEKPLYSKEFGPCVAVLARGYKGNSKLPTHLALHHVFRNTELLAKTLSDLVNRVSVGTVEIFISGGMDETQNSRKEIYDIIKEAKTADCKIAVLDDTFGIADLGTPYKCTERSCFPMSPGISYTGFVSPEQNPVQIISLRDEHKDVLESDIRKVQWFKI